MTIDLRDKYIYSLQCIAEMQEEIMTHKKRIAEYEMSAKRLCTLDEMIQVDIQTECSEQTLNMEIEESLENVAPAEQVNKEGILESISIPMEFEEVEKTDLENDQVQMDLVSDVEIPLENSNILEKITIDFTESIIQESLMELKLIC